MTYPLEVKARAIALLQEGYGTPTIERLIKEELGSGPDHATIRSWRADVAVSSIIREGNEELALRAGKLLHAGLDQVEESGDYKKHLLVLNVIRGTAIDKLHREQAPTHGNTYVFLQAPSNRSEPSAERSRSGIEPTTHGIAQPLRAEIELTGTVTSVKNTENLTDSENHED